jgi:hypothetical protein
MTLTKKKKMLLQQRKTCNPDNVCLSCGKKLGHNGIHHFFCDDCYTPGLMYSSYIKRINKVK